jgi:hypothetical protein
LSVSRCVFSCAALDALEEDDGKVDLADTDRGKATPVRDSDEESAV